MISTDKCEKGNAFTTLQRLTTKDADPQQNPKRVTITICDEQFNTIKSKELYHRLDDFPAEKDMTESSLSIKHFNILTSIVILYEV